MELFAFIIQLLQAILPSPVLHQLYGRTECYEIAQFAHIDAVTVGIAYLGGGGYNDDLFGFQAAEHAYDALLQSGTTDDGVIDHHEGILSFSDRAVGDVVY